MLEQKGQRDGHADGRADAALNRTMRPRPNLALAVAFPGYRDAYLSSYGSAYETQRRAEDREAAAKLARQSKPAPSDKNTAFDTGWKDGFAGTPAKVKSMPANEAERYQRGYALGQRDHDFARASALRERYRNQKRQNSQGHSR